MYRCDCRPCSEYMLRVTSISNTGGSFFFVTDSTTTPKNGYKYIFKVPCSLFPLTAITTVDQVYIVVNGVNIPLFAPCGNYVFTDQIRCFNKDNCDNIVLRLAYGSTPAHFQIISQSLCCSTAYGMTASAAAVAANVAADTQTLRQPQKTAVKATKAPSETKSNKEEA